MSLRGCRNQYVSATFPLWQIYVVRSHGDPNLSAIALFGPQPIPVRPRAKRLGLPARFAADHVHRDLRRDSSLESPSSPPRYIPHRSSSRPSALLIGEPVAEALIAILIGFLGCAGDPSTGHGYLLPLALIPLPPRCFYALPRSSRVRNALASRRCCSPRSHHSFLAVGNSSYRNHRPMAADLPRFLCTHSCLLLGSHGPARMGYCRTTGHLMLAISLAWRRPTSQRRRQSSRLSTTAICFSQPLELHHLLPSCRIPNDRRKALMIAGAGLPSFEEK